MFFYKQKTAYEMRISYWSSDACSSDLTDRLLKVAEALDQSAAQAKADMGVVIADLPRVETLARSVGKTIRTLGSEARTQAGDLEVGLSRLAQESSAAQ